MLNPGEGTAHESVARLYVYDIDELKIPAHQPYDIPSLIDNLSRLIAAAGLAGALGAAAGTIGAGGIGAGGTGAIPVPATR